MAEYFNSANGTISRPWTRDEINRMAELSREGYINQQIAEALGRSLASVSIKKKRLQKQNGTYSYRHKKEKDAINEEFINFIKPETMLELYAGDSKNPISTKNDIDETYETDYHMDALKCACKLYAEGRSYDVVDLDPYGSPYELIDLSLKLAKKGLMVTFGELGHRRFNRVDFVKPRYGIETPAELTLENLIEYIAKRASLNKKVVYTFKKKTWTNIGRVWLKIEENSTLKKARK